MGPQLNLFFENEESAYMCMCELRRSYFFFLATSQKYGTTQVGGNFIRLSGPNFYGKESGGDNLVPCPIAS